MKAHIPKMAQYRARLLEVTIAAVEPTLWKWFVSETGGKELMVGFEASRETAQIQGNGALFLLLAEGQK